MPESILVYKNVKTRPSHHKSFCFFKRISYALKRINKVNDHSLGRPKHLTKYMRMNHVLLYVSTLQLANKTIFHGDFFSPTWQTKITDSESKILRFPRYRHICYRAPGKCACIACTRYRHNHDTGTLFRCPRCVPVSSIYCRHKEKGDSVPITSYEVIKRADVD